MLRQRFVQGAAITMRGRTKRERLIDEAVRSWLCHCGLKRSDLADVRSVAEIGYYAPILICAEFRRLAHERARIGAA